MELIQKGDNYIMKNIICTFQVVFIVPLKDLNGKRQWI
jgi:hypothetical protein